MYSLTNVAHWTIRVTGLIQIILGIFIWTGNADKLIPLHVVSGILLVLSLWVLSATAVRAGVASGFVLLVVIWSVVVPILGATQTRILTGNAHWVIQVIHLLIGLGAIGLGERLYVRIEDSQPGGTIPHRRGSPA